MENRIRQILRSLGHLDQESSSRSPRFLRAALGRRGQDSVDEVPELRCCGEPRRLSRREMLDTSRAAGPATPLALLQLEHEGVVGA